jgi:type II restriction enzyme
MSAAKSARVQRLETEALDILASVGIPVVDKTVRAKQMMAVCFLSVAGVTRAWSEAKGLDDRRHLKTREIIAFANQHLDEKISPGSYDDIRRKHLKLMVLADLIVNSGINPTAATNDPTRGNALHPDFKKLVRTYGTPAWKKALAAFNKNKPSLEVLLLRKRDMQHIPVTLPGGKRLDLSLGKHNDLQKAIIEQFLPLWGHGAEVLYVGDTANKLLHIERDALKKLGFFDLSHDELPDVIAYSKKKNWLFVIEAVHSSGPISEVRLLELKKLLASCKAGIVYVTAFLTRKAHAKYADQIAYETEVWTADRPEHLQHLNGPRFMGPY